MFEVHIEGEAHRELVESISHYDQAREGLGGEFLDEVKALLWRIGENPNLYPVLRKRAHKALMARFPYAIVYRVEAEKVKVLAIWHTSRNPAKLRRRLK